MKNKDEKIDLHRRAFLLRSTAVLGAVGLGISAVPFIASLWPSKVSRATGLPARINISQIKPGEQKTVMWRGKPIWIVHRTPEELAALPKLNNELRDPNSTVDQQPAYARNLHRSIKPEFLVLVGVCTHLGCIPTYRPEPGSVTPNWPGGFFCTCHGSKFDMAGRVYKGVPAPINLEVPQYAFINDNEIVVGSDKATE